jgi:hypothetical protein
MFSMLAPHAFALPKIDVDLMGPETTPTVAFFSIGPVKVREGERVRALESQSATFTFTLEAAYPVLITVRLASRLLDQKCSISANGGFLVLEKQGDSFLVEGKLGPNQVSFFCRDEATWRNILKIYEKKFGKLACLNLFKLRQFYFDYRNEPAYFTRLSVRAYSVNSQ